MDDLTDNGGAGWRERARKRRLSPEARRELDEWWASAEEEAVEPLESATALADWHAPSADETLSNCHYLLGKYGDDVDQGIGGPQLAEMVADLRAVLYGTWSRPPLDTRP